jgi:hypothetical protein
MATREPLRRLSRTAYEALTVDERSAYDARRRAHHGRLGPYPTKAVSHILDRLRKLLDENASLPSGDMPWGAVIDGEPGIGKSKALRQAGAIYRRARLRELGEETAAGDRHIPWVHVRTTADSTVNGLAESILDAMDLPLLSRTENLGRLSRRVVKALDLCGTGLLSFEDIHAVRPRDLEGERLNKFLKYVMGETGITIAGDGVGLDELGFFAEGRLAKVSAASQIGERFERLPLDPIDITEPEGEKDWARLLKGIETDLMLVGERARVTSKPFASYLHSQTEGKLGRLMPLIRRGANEVVDLEAAGDWDNARLTPQLLDKVGRSRAGDKRADELKRADGLAEAA